MKMGWGKRKAFLQVLAITAVFSACDVAGTPSACSLGSAQLSVGENYIRRDCGCAEGAGLTYSTDLVCTVPVGTKMFFNYESISTVHQIHFVAYTTQFSPHNPGDTSEDAITLTTTTSGLQFNDIGHSTGGTIIVQ